MWWRRKNAGADTIIVTGISRDAGRLELARRLGADFTIDVEKDSALETLAEFNRRQGSRMPSLMPRRMRGRAR